MILSPAARWLLRAAAAGRAHVHLRAARAGAAQLVQRERAPSPGRRPASRCAGGRSRRRTRACATPCSPRCRSALLARPSSPSCSARWRRSALVRYEFFGRDGRVAAGGAADRAARHRHRHRPEHRCSPGSWVASTFFTLVIGHATFCIVVVVNNASARLRRMSGLVEEASMDLGATPWTTWRARHVPGAARRLLAGALLAFALSLRRDRRHDVHRGPRPADPAAVDLPEPVPPEPGPDRQRRRRRAGAGLGPAGVPGQPAVRRHRRYHNEVGGQRRGDVPQHRRRQGGAAADGRTLDIVRPVDRRGVRDRRRCPGPTTSTPPIRSAPHGVRGRLGRRRRRRTG